MFREYVADPSARPLLLTLYRRPGRKAVMGFLLRAGVPAERVECVISGLPPVHKLPGGRR